MLLTQSLPAQERSPESIRQTAAEVVARPEFRLDEGMSQESEAIWLLLLKTLFKPILWLFDALGTLPVFLKVIVITVLVVVLVALLTHIIWSVAVALRGRKPLTVSSAAGRQKEPDPAELESAAGQAAIDRRYLDGIRLLLKAALLRIERAQKRKLRVGISNRELLRRYRKSSVGTSLELLIDTVDRKWYGGEDCFAADFERCLIEQNNIRQATGGT